MHFRVLFHADGIAADLIQYFLKKCIETSHMRRRDQKLICGAFTAVYSDIHSSFGGVLTTSSQPDITERPK